MDKNYDVLRRPGEANFSEIIKIVLMLIKKPIKTP